MKISVVLDSRSMFPRTICPYKGCLGGSNNALIKGNKETTKLIKEQRNTDK